LSLFNNSISSEDDNREAKKQGRQGVIAPCKPHHNNLTQREVNIMGTESIASEKANKQERASVPSILDEFLELQGGKCLLS
jgi:hypothetical protein